MNFKSPAVCQALLGFLGAFSVPLPPNCAPRLEATISAAPAQPSGPHLHEHVQSVRPLLGTKGTVETVLAAVHAGTPASCAHVPPSVQHS